MKLLFFILLLILITPFTFAQNGPVKTYYNNSDTLKSVINYSKNMREGKAIFYYPNGKMMKELNYENGEVSGLVKEYYSNGKLRIMYTVTNGKREGPASLFDSTGNYLKDVSYENGMLIRESAEDTTVSAKPLLTSEKTDTAEERNKAPQVAQLKKKAAETNLPSFYGSNGTIKDRNFTMATDSMPVPSGGLKALQARVVYPDKARENNIHGTVEIRAFVDAYGEVEKTEIVKGLGYGCAEAARIAIYYSLFKPAMKNGKPVSAQVVIPIVFGKEK